MQTESKKKYVDLATAEKRLEGPDQSYRNGFRDGWTDALLGQSFNTINGNSNVGNYSAGYRYGYSQQTAANA